MSSERAAIKQQSGPPPSIFGRGPMGGFGMPVQKAKDFKGTLRRLIGYLDPHRTGLTIVIGAGVIATVFSVVGPKLLGMATTKVFEGYLGRERGTSAAGIDFALNAQEENVRYFSALRLHSQQLQSTASQLEAFDGFVRWTVITGGISFVVFLYGVLVSLAIGNIRHLNMWIRLR